MRLHSGYGRALTFENCAQEADEGGQEESALGEDRVLVPETSKSPLMEVVSMLIFADGSSGERASREHVSKPLFQAQGAQEPKPEPDPAASASAAADADLVLWDAIGESLKARWRPEAVGSSMLRGLGLRSITAERQKELSLRRLAQSQSPQAPQEQEGDTTGDTAGETTGYAAAKAQVVPEGNAGAAGDTGTKEQEGPLAPKFSEAVGKAEVEGGVGGGRETDR